MGQTKDNAVARRLVAKRDKAYARLEFNKKLPGVTAALIDQKNNRALKRQELKSKKKLFGLELRAMSEADRNAVLAHRGLEAEREKQVMPRRAIQQAYRDNLEKMGEAGAAKQRDASLERLDLQLREREAALRRKYPSNASTSAPHEATARYEQQAKAQSERRVALAAGQQVAKEKRMQALAKKLAAQNQKLEAAFESASGQLRGLSRIDEQDFQGEHVLCIRNLKMYFSGIKAVDDLSFDVKQGEIFGLIGPNGAGKTTLFNCITQFYKPTSGSILYRDRFGDLVDLTAYNTHDVVKVGISRTFQNLELVYYLTVLENLLVGAHTNYGATLMDQFLHTRRLKDEEKVYREHALNLLERLGILEYRDAYPVGLPYGVLKKIELARTLMSGPRLIILDEPAAGLNDAETEDLANSIRTIRDDFGCVVFLVEHDMNLVMGICDTVCAISFGKMLAMGTPAEIQNNQLVQEAYLGVE